MSEAFSLLGRLSEIRFAELILKLSARLETGVLHLWRGGIEKHVYFQEGKIVFARSNDPDERLGALFLRRNKITYRQLSDAADKVVPGKRLGTILVLDGYITPTDLYQGVLEQIKEILYTSFGWEDGQYEFTPGDLPSDEVITLNLSTPDIVLSGLYRVWRWSWVRSGSISLDAVFRKRDGWSVIARKMTMTPELQSILEMLDRPRTLEEILQNSKIGNFEACRLMWGMLLLGIAEQILNAPTWATEAATQEFTQTARILAPIFPEAPVTPIDLRESTMEMRSPSPPEDVIADAGVISKPEPPLEEPTTVDTSEPTMIITPEPTMVITPEATMVIATEPAIVITPESTMVLIAPPATVPEQEPEATEPAPEQQEEIETVVPESAQKEEPVEDLPSAELSFSDLADLTDSAEHLPTPPAGSESIELLWEKQVPFDIKSLNEQHRYLFEMLRLELGAGVNPFLSKMVKKVLAKYPLVFDGVRLNDFGEFDEGPLTSNIEGNLVEKYHEAFDYLLTEELSTIRTFLDKKRAASIENGLARISQKQGLVS